MFQFKAKTELRDIYDWDYYVSSSLVTDWSMVVKIKNGVSTVIYCIYLKCDIVYYKTEILAMVQRGNLCISTIRTCTFIVTYHMVELIATNLL